MSTVSSGLTYIDSSTSAGSQIYHNPFGAVPSTVISMPSIGIYQVPSQEVRRRTKELRILPSLKGFDVTLTDAHGNAKSSEYSEDELKAALPDLLAKLKKEPKEE